jgi:hypothetical protein
LKPRSSAASEPASCTDAVRDDVVSGPRRGEVAAIAAVTAIAISLVLYPVIVNATPPLIDYIQHLSSVFVLHNLIHGDGFADMYRIHLAVVPNLGVVGVVLPLLELGLPAEAAGRWLLVLTFLALSAGVLSLHYAAFRRISVWPVLALPFLYQDFLFYGFINYLLGVGLAMIAAAIWRLNAEVNLWRAGIVLLISALVLFFTHLIAQLLVFGLVVGVELSGVLRLGSSRRANAWQRLAVAVAAAGAPLALLLFAPLVADHDPPSLHAALQQLTVQSVVLRAKALFWFTWAYDPTLDAASQAGVVALGAYVLLRGLIRFDVPSFLPILGLVAIYLVVPDGWFNTSYLPNRLPMVIFLISVAATDVVSRQAWERTGLLLIVAVLAVTRGLAVERPDGSRIYAADAERTFRGMRRLPIAQLACYAPLYRHIFCPETKANPTDYWIVPQPPYDAAPHEPRSYQTEGSIGAPPDDPYAPALLGFYDYALIVHPTLWPQSPPPSLKPLLVTADYTLFQIEHPDGRRGQP